ncbi:hypothetical protein HAX54_041993 [Datura stramonium]|uniref:Uncharacterized protein n=1 Tax=Datura stramonium TaxID=4076 RepID=A0ABS8W0W9_DATST|nr:hypothetical protein [Datura stramonium]
MVLLDISIGMALTRTESSTGSLLIELLEGAFFQGAGIDLDLGLLLNIAARFPLSLRSSSYSPNSFAALSLSPDSTAVFSLLSDPSAKLSSSSGSSALLSPSYTSSAGGSSLLDSVLLAPSSDWEVEKWPLLLSVPWLFP